LPLIRFLNIIAVALVLLFQSAPLDAQDEAKVYSLVPKEIGTDVTSYVFYSEHAINPTQDRPFSPSQLGPFTLNKKRSLSFGYSSSNFWLRFAISNPGPTARDLAIIIDYPLLDEIVFYDPSGDGYEETISGDSEPFSKRWVRYRNFAYPTRIEGGETKTYYMRVKSTSTLSVPLQIWDVDAFKEHAIGEGPALGFYFGCMTAILFYNIFIYISTRSQAYLSYLVFILSSTVLYLAWGGIGPMYLWGESQLLTQRIWPVAAGFMSFSSMKFLSLFLSLQDNAPRLAPIHQKLVWAWGVAVLICCIGPLGLAYKVGFSFGAAAAFYAFGVGLYLTLKGNRQAIIYLIAWSVLLFFITLSFLVVIGALALPMEIGSYGSQIGSALEAIFLSLGLADRINGMKKKELEQSQSIIDGLQKIEVLKHRLESVLSATKKMSEQKEKSAAMLDASHHIQKELSHLETRHVWYLEQDKKTGEVHRLILSETDSHDEAWDKEWLEVWECVSHQQEIIVPIIWNGMRFGVFCISTRAENTNLPPEDVNFLEAMMQSLALSLQNIDYQNNLKHMVDERTFKLNQALQALTERQRKIDDILRNIEQGIFTFDENFNIGEEYSKYLLDIFQIQKSDMSNLSINTLLFQNTDLNPDRQNTAMEALKASVGGASFLWELNAHHLPNEIVKLYETGLRNIELEWKPLISGIDHVDHVMVVAKDVTERRILQKRLEEEEVHKQRFIRILTKMVSIDKDTLNSFFSEVKKSIAFIRTEIRGPFSSTLVFRSLHTMKGLSRSLNFDNLSSLIHECESLLVEPVDHSQKDWTEFERKFVEMEACFDEYLQVYDQIFGAPDNDLRNWNLMQFLAQVLPERLDAIRAQHYPVAAITCQDRVMAWNVEIVRNLREILLHLFNNSLDHGFLLPFSDQLEKKPIQIELNAQIVGNDVEIILEDYGAGLDADKLIAKAKSRGIPFDPEDPYALIFQDGISTAQKTTITSGRGVGLAAVRGRVVDLGGSITIGTMDHAGTQFVIRLPKALAVQNVEEEKKAS
jgi:two-component sensor histidine kinase